VNPLGAGTRAGDEVWALASTGGAAAPCVRGEVLPFATPVACKAHLPPLVSAPCNPGDGGHESSSSETVTSSSSARHCGECVDGGCEATFPQVAAAAPNEEEDDEECESAGGSVGGSRGAVAGPRLSCGGRESIGCGGSGDRGARV